MFLRSIPGFVLQAPGAVLRAWRDQPGIVIVRGRKALGDRLMVTPLLRALKKHVPALHVSLAARHRDVYRGNPNVDQVRGWHFWETRRTISPVGKIGQHVVEKMWAHVWDHLVQRGLAEGDPPEIDIRPEIFLTEAEKAWGRSAVARPEGRRPVVALIGGGRLSPTWNREWGLENYCALAQALEPHAQLLQIAGDRPITFGPGRAVRFVTADVRQAAAVLAACDAFVTQEGGLMHLAASVNTPTVVIYGGAWRPSVTGYEQFRNLATSPECSPCHGRNEYCTHLSCMKSITVRKVAREIASLLAKRGFELPEEAIASAPDSWTPPGFLPKDEAAVKAFRPPPPRQRSRRHQRN